MNELERRMATAWQRDVDLRERLEPSDPLEWLTPIGVGLATVAALWVLWPSAQSTAEHWYAEPIDLTAPPPVAVVAEP